LAQHGGVDFGDLIMRPTRLLERDAGLRSAVQLRHRHVLVDEYQDINRASARLVQAVAGDAQRLWVVGDARQSIYRFRGASSMNMVEFANDFAGAVVDRLDVNYRSSQEVVSTFQAFAPHMSASSGMLPLALEAEEGSSDIRPQLRVFQTAEDELEGVAAAIRELEGKGVRLRDQAVLCRSNARLNEFAAGLEARGIPVLHLGSLFERSEIRDLLALLTLLVDPFGAGLIRVGAMPRYAIPLQDLWIVVSRLRGSKSPAIGELATVAKDEALCGAARAGLARLAEDLRGLSTSKSAWEFLARYLLDNTDVVARQAAETSIAAKMRGVAVWQFLNFVRDQSPMGSGSPIHRTLERVRQLVLLAEERDLRQIPTAALHMDAVRLMTVHGSKGLEFEAVHVPGLTKASFPSSNRGERCPPPNGLVADRDELTPKEAARRAHEAEEQCLFFVALSRARQHLRLYHCLKQTSGANRTRSPYLDHLGAVMDVLPNPPVLKLPPGSVVPGPIKVGWPTDWRLTDARLESYEKCPRRFFYTHVLSLGGRKKMTAFSQAYAVEYRALADRLLRNLVRSGDGRQFRPPEDVVIDFAEGRLVVEPSEIIELPNGSVILRRIRTGYRRSDEYDKLAYGLYHLAGRGQFGTGYSVEALHLTDDTLEIVTLTDVKTDNRRKTAIKFLGGIARGEFPPEIDAVTCPRCPHFFICGATPTGPLDLSQ
jgi:DNA helicase-2/ATP-dependent DNA helicase PcrA